MLHKEKRFGFFILEVLFAIMIISAAVAGVFRVLHRAIILIGKLKHNTKKVSAEPLIYSVYSPSVNMQQRRDQGSDPALTFVNVKLIQNGIDLNKKYLYVIKKNAYGSDEHAFYSNTFMMLPDDKNDKEGSA